MQSPSLRPKLPFGGLAPSFYQIPTIFFLFLAIFSANAQPVASSCDGGSNLIAAWKNDAYQIAYQRLEAQNNPALDGVELPTDLRDSILRAIFAVFNATSLPARDTVFEQFDIHAYAEKDLHRVQILVDTTYGWTHNWLDNQAVTGNSWIDYLVNQYDLTVENVQFAPEWVLNYDAAITLQTDKFINGNFLAGLISNSSGVVFGYGLTFGGDGDHIYFDTKPGYIELTFRHGWTDCPTGCVFHRDWLFKIYPDCSVEFVSAYGDLLGTMVGVNVLPFENLQIYPVPASDFMFISAEKLNGTTINIELTNQLGQTVLFENQPIQNGHFDGSLTLELLPDGFYFLTLSTENQRITRSVMKQN
jgi:Secretion system C-terminal sorting domain